MKFIPAIDLKDSKCVRLQKGKKEDITVFNKNPVEQAIFFEKNGCQRIHIVDLDGAFGNPNINKKIILKIKENINIPIELGGGIKCEDDIDFWINEGINYLILGSLAIKNKNLILDMASKYKQKIYVALDVFHNKVMVKGWVEDSKKSIEDILGFYKLSNIKGFVLTDISRDGMLEGLDISLIKNFLKKTTKDVIVGGGLSNYDDIVNLKKIKSANLEGVIAGKAFYAGNINIKNAISLIKQDA